jgi:predicted nucleic acid-binding Zn ribbon protein
MIHCYKCPACGKEIEIDKPLAEQYVPECCGKKAQRVFKDVGILAGALNANNLAK